MKNTFRLLIIITLLCGIIYTAGQQILRSGANDPQIQIAEDMGGFLAGGVTPQSLMPSGIPVEISSSTATYAIIFDDSEKIILSSALLNGNEISLPKGIFDYARAHTEERVTWEPQEGTRQALVVRHYSGPKSGFVAVGRSLREVEKRETSLLSEVLVGWVMLVIVCFFGYIYDFVKRKIESINETEVQ